MRLEVRKFNLKPRVTYMNTEIVRELVRQWRRKAEPATVSSETAVGDEANTITQSVLDRRLLASVAEARKECAQDLEDVIRIYCEFHIRL